MCMSILLPCFDCCQFVTRTSLFIKDVYKYIDDLCIIHSLTFKNFLCVIEKLCCCFCFFSFGMLF